MPLNLEMDKHMWYSGLPFSNLKKEQTAEIHKNNDGSPVPYSKWKKTETQNASYCLIPFI